MELNLQNKSVIVTGGGSNIGRAISLAFARERVHLSVAEIDEGQGEKTAAEALRLGAASAQVVKTDVTNWESVCAMVKAVEARHGKVDVLVNNVGWTYDRLFMEKTRAEWDKEVQLNLWGMINCTRAVLDGMIEKKAGAIVSMGSDAGRMGEFREAVYGACKAGVIALSKSLAREVGRSSAVRAMTLTAAGRAFCAGADLKAVRELSPDPVKWNAFMHLWHRVFNRLEALPVPVVAGVHGFALAGGLELALVVDLVVADESARLGDQHANFGLVAGGGGSQRLPRLIGARRAKELMLLGGWLSAAQSLEWGLVNRVAPAGRLEAEVDELATSLADKSPSGNRTVKALVDRGLDMDLGKGLALELDLVAEHMRSADAAEGLRAFAEKRAPVFRST